MKFLSELKQYLAVIRSRPEEFQYVISQALQDEALAWWDIHDNDIADIEEFEEKFKDRFWNARIQRETKRNIEMGNYDYRTDKNRVKYATKLLSLAKDLSMNYNEEELIKTIGDHFSRDVRNALIGQKIVEKNAFLKLLQEFDQDTERYLMSKKAAENAKSNSNQRENRTAHEINALKSSKESKEYEKNSKDKKQSNYQQNRQKHSSPLGKTNAEIVQKYDQDIDISKIEVGPSTSGAQSGNLIQLHYRPRKKMIVLQLKMKVW